MSYLKKILDTIFIRFYFLEKLARFANEKLNRPVYENAIDIINESTKQCEELNAKKKVKLFNY